MYPAPPKLDDKSEIWIAPWNDPAIVDGFDVRSAYTEMFWLPILGPSVVWLMRSFVHRLEDEPDGFTLDFAEAAHALGMRFTGSRNSPFNRSLSRLVTFSMGRVVSDDTIECRVLLPRLKPSQVQRLSPTLQVRHKAELRHIADNEEKELDRTAQVAATLLSLGDSPDLVERQLVNWGISARVSTLAVNMAWADKARADQRRAESRRLVSSDHVEAYVPETRYANH